MCSVVIGFTTDLKTTEIVSIDIVPYFWFVWVPLLTLVL